MRKVLPLDGESQSQTPKRSTSQKLKSVGLPCLRRHQDTQEYYGLKKVNGKIHTIKLRLKNGQGTKDRKLAERLLKDWLNHLTAPPAKSETLRHIIEIRKRDEVSKLSESRKRNFRWLVSILETQFPQFIDSKLQDITASSVEEVLKKIRPSNKKFFSSRSFNELATALGGLFEMGVRNSLISENPFKKVPKNIKWKTVKNAPSYAPSFEQFYKIVDRIRANRFTDHSNESAAFIEFMGCAGLGAAEVRSISWKDIQNEVGHPKILVQRKKTGMYFEIPIFPELQPVIDKLKTHSQCNLSGLLFNIKTVPKKAFASACKELGYPNYTPRSLRKMRITNLLRSGINYQLVSKWQGHQDGGILILKTYSNIISECEESFESIQISKLYDQHKQLKSGS